MASDAPDRGRRAPASGGNQGEKGVAKKKRGIKGEDVVRVIRVSTKPPEWAWERFSTNHEYIVGSWPETLKRRIDCVKSAERAMTKCKIEIEK